jgi:putative spermidine/putrescine transport system substrate-binding protein
MTKGRHYTRRGGAAALAVAAAVAALVAAGGSASGATNWSTATSAASGGGLAALIKAAQAEGTLNVIALPPTWANYGELISTFSKKYGIHVVSSNPNGSSSDEITAVQTLGSQSRAPDVVDVGQSYALADANLFAPYKVATWGQIPAANKDPKGAWYNDYGGYISIGCNNKIVAKCPTSYKDLLNPAYKNDVALDGDPTQANAAFSGVWAAALANGGSFSNIAPGLAFFKKLHQLGNFVATQATQATIQSGQTPIVIDWDYLNAAAATAFKKQFKFTVVIPTDASFAAYYAQAISAKAPHPAAARLWEEFLYSAQGQNLWLKGQSRPIELAAMIKNGTVNQTWLKGLPAVPHIAKYPTAAQVTAAKAVVAAQWASTQS